jgi:hypothetical protein
MGKNKVGQVSAGVDLFLDYNFAANLSDLIKSSVRQWVRNVRSTDGNNFPTTAGGNIWSYNWPTTRMSINLRR